MEALYTAPAKMNKTIFELQAFDSLSRKFLRVVNSTSKLGGTDLNYSETFQKKSG